MKAKTKKVDIDPETIEDMMWMTYRYCIGSHTIATHMMAGQLATLLRDNPTLLSPERKRFCGRDIRGTIGSIMRYMRHISVDGYQEHHDALSLLLGHCVDYNIKPSELWLYSYTIDTALGICVSERLTQEPTGKADASDWMTLDDLMVWVKLAGYLDPTERITYEWRDQQWVKDGFCYYDIDRLKDTITRRHITCEHYAEEPDKETWIADEYITKIENI